MARNSALAAYGLAAAVGVGCSGCAGSSDRPAGTDRVRPSYSSQTGSLEKITYDRDGNGRPDAWAYMEGPRIRRADLDENGDGAVERREFYGPGEADVPAGVPQGLKGAGVIERAEQLREGTGVVFRREAYTRGTLASVEEDSDGDGRVDKWETWADGTLAVLALDTQGRGTPDRRLIYDSSGVRVEIDRDGDGRFTPEPAAR